MALQLAALTTAGFYLAAWYVSRSPLNGLTLLLLRMLLLDLVPACAYLIATHAAVVGRAPRLAAALYITLGAALTLGYWLTRRGGRINVASRTRVHSSTQLRAITLTCCLCAYCALAVHHVSTRVAIEPFTRPFYVATRLGWGSFLFTAETAAFLSLLVSLVFLEGTARLLGCAIAEVLLASFGAKGPPIMGVAMLAYFSFLKSFRLGFAKAVLLAASAVIALYAAFWLYSPWARGRLIAYYLGYNDATANLMVEINGWGHFAWGQLELEDTLYSVVPRSLFPSKPEFFGERRLAGQFYPRRVTRNQGDPSFSMFGLVWADFGEAAFLVIALQGVIQGALIGALERRLLAQMSVGLLIAYLALVGLPVFVPGGESLAAVAVNLAIGALAALWFRARLRPRTIPAPAPLC